MSAALTIRSLGKRFVHHDAARAKTFRRFVEGGWGKRGGKYDFWALRDVDFSVEPGEMLGVIGKNGSGKSTLLRLLGGVMRPDEGSVEAADAVHGLLDLNAGMHHELTGRENAICTGVLAGLSRREITARMDEVIEFAELKDFIDEPLRSYSAGMKLRLGFAVAAQTRPRILLIDEVLAVGDVAFQAKCIERIHRFRAEGCAIVLISHDLAQVEATCDRALWLRNGAQVALGAAQSVVRQFETAMLEATAERIADNEEADLTGGSQLTLSSNRFGTQENRITRVRLLGSNGEEISSIRTGDPLTIQAWIETVIPMSDLHFSVTLANAKGTDILGVTTEQDMVELPAQPGTAMLQVDLARLDLAGGLYHFSIGLYDKDWAIAYDRHVNAYELKVEGQESWASLNPAHEWTVA